MIYFDFIFYFISLTEEKKAHDSLCESTITSWKCIKPLSYWIKFSALVQLFTQQFNPKLQGWKDTVVNHQQQQSYPQLNYK